MPCLGRFEIKIDWGTYLFQLHYICPSGRLSGPQNFGIYIYLQVFISVLVFLHHVLLQNAKIKGHPSAGWVHIFYSALVCTDNLGVKDGVAADPFFSVKNKNYFRRLIFFSSICYVILRI